MKTRFCFILCGCLVLGTGFARADDAEKPKPGQSRDRKVDPDKLFDRLDKNKDGFIDKEEAPERLKEHFDKLDTNKDGKISREEFKQSMSLLQQFRGGSGGKPRPGQGGAGKGEALFERLDKNKDGYLTKEELPEKLKEHFDKMDANKDGKISKEEFQQSLKLIREQRKGEGDPKKPAGNPPAAGDSKPAEKKPADSEESKKSSLPTFDSLDKNADGRLTREEVKGTPLEGKFDEIDANKDGKIDPKEYEAYLKKAAKK